MYRFKDMIRQNVENFMKTIFYISTGKINNNIKIPINYLNKPPNEIQLKYKLDHYLPEFLVFASIFILPMKFLRIRQTYF